MKKFFLFCTVVLLVGFGYWTFGQKSDADFDPIKVAGDTHKLKMENAFVRVIETHLPPGKSEPMHAHQRGVVIYLSDFKVKITEQGEQPRDVERKQGDIRWRDRTLHSVVNTGNTEGHVISVELK